MRSFVCNLDAPTEPIDMPSVPDDDEFEDLLADLWRDIGEGD
ncbi:hypothetical protein [Zavarzinella formosa]|nr:hypothetical protein [Zavarzinella formosa]